MSRPAGVERERLDQALHDALAPILRSLAVEVSRLRVVTECLLRPEPPIRLNDASALPAFEPDLDAIARLRAGRRLSVVGLGGDPSEALEADTDAIDAFARLVLTRHVAGLERAIPDLELLAVDSRADQEARLESFLESLPSPLLAELERVTATWPRPEGQEHDERLDRLLSEQSAKASAEPAALVAEIRRLLALLVELSSSKAGSPDETPAAQAARLIEPLLELVLGRDRQPAKPRGDSE